MRALPPRDRVDGGEVGRDEWMTVGAKLRLFNEASPDCQRGKVSSDSIAATCRMPVVVR